MDAVGTSQGIPARALKVKRIWISFHDDLYLGITNFTLSASFAFEDLLWKPDRSFRLWLGERSYIYPDSYFGLSGPIHVFLELDTGSEVILHGEKTIKRRQEKGQIRKDFAIKVRFFKAWAETQTDYPGVVRMLWVCHSDRRLRHLIEVARAISPSPLFWFTTTDRYDWRRPETVRGRIWRTAADEERHAIEEII